MSGQRLAQAAARPGTAKQAWNERMNPETFFDEAGGDEECRLRLTT